MLKNIMQAGFLVLAMQLAGCGTTAEISNAWVDPALQSKDLKGVLVVGIAKKQELRIEFEDAFTKRLVKEGSHAIASHTLIPLKADKDEVLAVARLAGLESILVIRYAGSVEEPVWHRGTTYYALTPVYGADYHGRFGGYYGYAKAYSDPDIWTTNKYVSLVCDLYNTATEEPVWQASSIAMDPDERSELRDAFINAFVKQMKKQDLID